ncbi:MAG: hypothetical protein AAGE94_22585 [Acidobacteriota bacterium]
MTGFEVSVESWRQMALLAAEAVGVAVLLSVLFRGRHRFGLSPLFATLGVFQYLQVILAFSLYIEILPGVSVSPGSVVLFSGSLYGLLLVYLRESPAETRTLVYGILAANLSLSVLSLMLSFHLDSPLLRNPHELPDGLFRLDTRIMVVGTLTLVLDMLLMLVLYPATGRWLRSQWLRAAVTLCGVLAFDSLVFMTGAFWGEPFYPSALGSAVVAKGVVGLFYAAALAGYMRWVEPSARAQQTANAGQVLRWQTPADGADGPAPRDPDLGVLSALPFEQVVGRFVALGEQLASPVAVFVVSLADEPVDPVECRDRLRYLLAVLRQSASPSAAFGRVRFSGLAMVVPGTDVEAARRIVGGIPDALGDAFSRIRPTRDAERFDVRVGWTCSARDGNDAAALLRLADPSSESKIASR